MDLTQNYFQLFGLPQCLLSDSDELTDKYRKLQREMHPDKFASKSAEEQRLSVQFISLVNTAYQTLKSPLLSAEYLLTLADHPLNSENLTVNNGEFLFKQMEWREQLADLSRELKSNCIEAFAASEQLGALRSTVGQERQTLIMSLERAFEQQDYENMKDDVAKLHFVEKMLKNIDQLEDELVD